MLVVSTTKQGDLRPDAREGGYGKAGPPQLCRCTGLGTSTSGPGLTIANVLAQ